MKEWRKGCEVIWKCGLLDWNGIALGELEGSGDMQGFDKGKEW